MPRPSRNGALDRREVTVAPGAGPELPDPDTAPAPAQRERIYMGEAHADPFDQELSTDDQSSTLDESVHPYVGVDVGLQYPIPTAEEFTTRRTVRPREWVATTGVRAAARRGTFGLVRLRPNRREREGRASIASVRRAFGGLRQITVVNPKGGAGKTVATLMLGLTFGQTRGGFVLAWDQRDEAPWVCGRSRICTAVPCGICSTI
jgi:hypothetical protein